jgi:pimeloyl-ACP methyl ester carboxylesterase
VTSAPPDARARGLEWRIFLTRLGEVSARVSTVRDTDADAIVLLHGAAGSWTTWLPLIDDALAAGRPLGDLVLIDLPGWGDSPPPAAPPRVRRRDAERQQAASIDDYAQSVVDVLHSLGYRRWRIVGHSLGGLLALHLAATEREATRSVGLVSATGPAVLDAIVHPLRGWRRMPAFSGLLTVMRVFAPFGTAASSILRALRPIGALRMLTAPLFAHPSQIDAAVLTALAHEIRPAAFSRAARMAADHDLGLRRRIVCPVLSVRGDRDVFATADDDRMLVESIRDATTVVLDSVGHFAQIEAPASVREALAMTFSPRS